MPKVTINGVVKHFPYTEKGKKKAKGIKKVANLKKRKRMSSGDGYVYT